MRTNTQLLDELIAKKKVIISAHRGQAGTNIIENTIPAFKNALLHGADMIEMDVLRSTDGKYYLFHDGNEMRLIRTGKNVRLMSSEEIESYNYFNYEGSPSGRKIEKFEDALLALKDKCLINLDRCWRLDYSDFDYVRDALNIVKKLGMEHQILYKSNVRNEILDNLEREFPDIMYMPIVSTVAEMEEVAKRNINTVAFEVLFPRGDEEIVSAENIKRWKDLGYYMWVNSINVSDRFILAGMHDDMRAINDGVEAWDFLIERGFDIIQTDWTAVVNNYLNEKVRK